MYLHAWDRYSCTRGLKYVYNTHSVDSVFFENLPVLEYVHVYRYPLEDPEEARCGHSATGMAIDR